MSKGKKFNTPKRFWKNIDAWEIYTNCDWATYDKPHKHPSSIKWKCCRYTRKNNHRWFFRNRKKFKELVKNSTHLGFNKFRAIEIWGWD